MAYSLDTGLFYVPSNEWGMDMWNEPITYKKGAAFLGAGFTIKPLYPDHIGVLRAVDPKAGKIVWEYKNKAPLWSGVLATKGGLVFAGTPEGFLKAFDAKTGEELWKFQTGSGVVGSPVTWEMDGEQYIAVISGWGGAVPLWGGEVAKQVKDISQGGSLWVFKLHRPSRARWISNAEPGAKGSPGATGPSLSPALRVETAGLKGLQIQGCRFRQGWLGQAKRKAEDEERAFIKAHDPMLRGNDGGRGDHGEFRCGVRPRRGGAGGGHDRIGKAGAGVAADQSL